MQISNFKFLIIFFCLIFNFAAKTLFVEEAVVGGVKTIGGICGKIATSFYRANKFVCKFGLPPAVDYVVNSKITTSLCEDDVCDYLNTKKELKEWPRNEKIEYIQQLNEFNKKIEHCIPFKKAICKLVLPLNTSPQSFFLNWFYNYIVSPTMGKILEQGKKIQAIKPICTHLSYIFQDKRGGAEEEKLGNEIAIRFLLKFCVNNYEDFFNNSNEFVEKQFNYLWSEMCNRWEESGSLKNKIYKQIILPFNSLFPIFYILFAYSRFYNPTFQFLKNVPGFSHAYRYIEWMHNRWEWLENELLKLKNIKISSEFVCFCAMSYLMRPTKLLTPQAEKIYYEVIKN